MPDRVTKPLTEDEILTLTAHFQDQHPIMDCDLLSLRALAELQSLRRKNERLRQACAKEDNDVISQLAPALGYPYSEEYGWVIGDHTGVTLAMEARTQLTELQPKEPRDE